MAQFVLATLSLLALFFYALTQVTFFDRHFVIPFTSLVAKSTVAALLATGTRTVTSGNTISLGNFSVVIVPACNGLEMMAIFVAAVLAFPARIRQKLVGITLGLVAVYVINIVRLVALFLIGAHFRSVFDQAHYYYGQAFLLLATVALWVLWVSRLSMHEFTSRD